MPASDSTLSCRQTVNNVLIKKNWTKANCGLPTWGPRWCSGNARRLRSERAAVRIPAGVSRRGDGPLVWSSPRANVSVSPCIGVLGYCICCCKNMVASTADNTTHKNRIETTDAKNSEPRHNSFFIDTSTNLHSIGIPSVFYFIM